MKEIDSNKHAWGQLSQDHYHAYKKRLLEGSHQFNPIIARELGDLSGKSVIHLQCNTGADTILLARGCKHAVGVDLVPGNIRYARQLAQDAGVSNVTFLESDIMALMEHHHTQYDVVFVSEGAIGWLPDLAQWGRTIRHLLKDGGYFYAFDSHPFMLAFDEAKLPEGAMTVQFPYFGKEPDVDDSIGGYASEAKHGVQAYFWMYTVSDLINSLASAGMRIDFFNEFPALFYNPGGMQDVGGGLFNYGWNTGKIPLSFSLRATAE